MTVSERRYASGPWLTAQWSASVPLMILVAVAAGAVTGIVAATGNLKAAVLLTAIIVGWFVIRSPTLLLWSVVALGLVISGLARLYTPEFEHVSWLLAPMSLALVLHATVTTLTVPDTGRRWPAMLWWASAFVVVLAISSLLNGVGGKSLVVALKGYFQVWGVLFALPFLVNQKGFIERLPRIFFWIALAQLPFVLHQLLVLVPARHGLGGGIVPVDVIAGTFGANRYGGGATSMLAAFMLIVLAGLLARWRYGLMSTLRLVLIGTFLMTPILVNEAKIAAVYVVVVFLVVFWEDIVTRPLRCAAVLAGISALLAIVLMAFALNVPSNKVHGISDLIQYTYDYNTSPNLASYDRRFSRWGALVYWNAQNGARNPIDTLIGHGAGVSRIAAAADDSGESGSQAQLGIGNTTVSAVLWEAGVLGLACLFLLHWYAVRAAGRLARIHRGCPPRAASFRAAQVAVIIFFINLWYNNAFVFDAPYQTLVVLILGAIAYADRVAGPVTGRRPVTANAGGVQSRVALHQPGRLSRAEQP